MPLTTLHTYRDAAERAAERDRQDYCGFPYQCNTHIRGCLLTDAPTGVTFPGFEVVTRHWGAD
jgi:hypothetical protein